MIQNRLGHILLMIGLTGMTLTGCVVPQTKYSNEFLSKKAKLGREIFNSNGACYACHGVDADDHTISEAVKPKLDPKPTNLRDSSALKYKDGEEIAKVIINGIPNTSMVAMGPPDGKLSVEEIDLLIAYLKEIRRR